MGVWVVGADEDEGEVTRDWGVVSPLEEGFGETALVADEDGAVVEGVAVP